MFFIIAGVSPKVTRIDREPRACPACGQRRAYRQRVDHVFNLFFIPLFRVKKGEELLFCDRCGGPAIERTGDIDAPPPAGRGRCPSCGAGLDPDFRYCPRCGQRL